jgi:hypothetical protein
MLTESTHEHDIRGPGDAEVEIKKWLREGFNVRSL